MRGICTLAALLLSACVADGAGDLGSELDDTQALAGAEALGGPCGGRFRIDDDSGFTLDQRARIAQAFRRMNAFVGRPVASLSPSASCAIVAAPLEDRYIAYFDGTSMIIDFEELRAAGREEGSRFEGVILHELGHAVGMEHVVGERALMAPGTRMFSEDFTPADRAECLRVRLCP